MLNRSGYRLLLANTDNNIEEELKYLNLFKDNQVDGILFIATMFTAKHRKLLKECKVPVVILGQRLEGYSCVYQDDYHAALKMTQALHENGDKIGYIGVTDKDEAAGLNRRRDMRRPFEKQEKALPEWMAEAKFSIESGYEQMRGLLSRSPDIDSVFCTTDNIAAGAMAYLKEAGKKCRRISRSQEWGIRRYPVW